MKCYELIRKLEKAKCYIIRHGKKHDIWYSPTTGNKTSIPRHGSQEIPNGTANEIMKSLIAKEK